jgi:hypothetical protein
MGSDLNPGPRPVGILPVGAVGHLTLKLRSAAGVRARLAGGIHFHVWVVGLRLPVLLDSSLALHRWNPTCRRKPFRTRGHAEIAFRSALDEPLTDLRRRSGDPTGEWFASSIIDRLTQLLEWISPTIAIWHSNRCNRNSLNSYKPAKRKAIQEEGIGAMPGYVDRGCVAVLTGMYRVLHFPLNREYPSIREGPLNEPPRAAAVCSMSGNSSSVHIVVILS